MEIVPFHGFISHRVERMGPYNSHPIDHLLENRSATIGLVKYGISNGLLLLTKDEIRKITGIYDEERLEGYLKSAEECGLLTCVKGNRYQLFKRDEIIFDLYREDRNKSMDILLRTHFRHICGLE